MVSADYSATHPSQSVLFAPPTPRPNYCFFFFFCFPCPALSAEQGPGDLAGCGIQRGPDRKPFCCGVGGKRGRGVKASPPAPPRPRMRTGAGPLWVGCPSPVSANLSEKGGDDGSSRPESPARRRAAAPRSGDGCRSKRPAVQGPYPSSRGLAECERQQCVCPVSFGVLIPTAGCWSQCRCGSLGGQGELRRRWQPTARNFCRDTRATASLGWLSLRDFMKKARR